MVMNFIRKLMYGRYGSDQLSFFLLVVYVVLILLSGLPHLEALSWLALAVLLWDLFRMFSRRIDRRRRRTPGFWLWPDPPYAGCGAPYHPPGQGAPLLQVPQLRTVSAGAPGEGKITVNCRNAAPALRSGAELSPAGTGAPCRAGPALPLQAGEKLVS